MDEKSISANDTVEELISQAREAAAVFTQYNQEEVDRIVFRAAKAGAARRIELARMAHEETGMGVFEDKVIKNLFATEYIYNDIKDVKTCKLLSDSSETGIMEYAEPLGIILGIVPVTNPTSTVMFKSLLALKTCNSIIFSAPRNALKCSIEAARTMYEAALEAGAPDYCIRWIEQPSRDLTHALMSHPDVALILATGGMGLVHAAYSSGTPAIGVGPGNVPVYIERSADIKRTVNDIIMSKTFDNGMICASEQSVVVDRDIAEEVIERFKSQGAYFLTPKETGKVQSVAIDAEKQSMSPKVVGQSPKRIAELAGISIPDNTKVLIAPLKGVGPQYPLSREKLSPILGFYIVNGIEEGVKVCTDIMHFGGLGHTASIASENPAAVREFSETINAGRILVNSPSTHGGIGGLYNRIHPSLTLGCGSGGKNITTDNVSVSHLLNIKRVSRRKVNMRSFRVPTEIYFEPGSMDEFFMSSIKGYNAKRAFIVCSNLSLKNGIVSKIEGYLRKADITTALFSDVQSHPTLDIVIRGVEAMRRIEPEIIIALGEGSSIDAAKGMWLLYEHPETSLEDLKLPFMDMSKRIVPFPRLGQRVKLIAIPTTSGTGSEVSTFSVITDNKTGVKYPLMDYGLTPNVAVMDPNLCVSMTPSMTADTGMDVLVHALEGFVSVAASDYTDPLALKAIELVFNYLPRAYKEGNDLLAREKMHNASAIAAMAFNNAFLGINQSLANALSTQFNIANGRAKALLMVPVIRYNAFGAKKFTPYPKYPYPQAAERYAQIALSLKIQASTAEEAVRKLIGAIEDLKALLDIPKSIQEYGVSLKDFKGAVKGLAERAFDDQCIGTNPCYPILEDIESILWEAYGSRQ